jgi:hypothetical protein
MRIGSLLPQAQPVGNFATLPASTNRPFTAFPRDYTKLPTGACVSPTMCHGMHGCSIRTDNRWMKKHFDRYARWAPRHNSWLIVTFDENAGGRVKPIFTIIVGANVRPDVDGDRLNHYRLLRTLEEAYGLPQSAAPKPCALSRRSGRASRFREAPSSTASRRKRHFWERCGL